MSTLVNMYVFYDDAGDIKAIAPSRKDFNDGTCSVAIFPLSEVEPFISGKKNTFDYEVKKIKSFIGEKFTLRKKVIEVNYTRTLDNYLTEIGTIDRNKTIISVTNNVSSKTINIELAPEFRILYNTKEEDEEIFEEIFGDIIKVGNTSIHITKKHDPYHHLFSIIFSPKELFEKGKLLFKYEDTIKNASAYTKKIVNEYGYKEVI